jgi:hypothetical protein
MPLVVDWVTIDAADPLRLARFWAEALDYDIDDSDAPSEVMLLPKDGSKRRLLLLAVPDAKAGKNRLHFDLRPDDQAAEVERLEQLGARRVDIGQGDVTWVVLADPEGNEFCVLRSLESEERGAVPWGD